MDSDRWIAIDDALMVTHLTESFAEGIEGVLTGIGAEGQSRHGLNQRRAIQLPGIHHQPFCTFFLEGMGHVGSGEELTCEEEWEVRGAWLLTGFAEQTAHRDAVGRQIDRPAPLPCLHRHAAKHRYP